MHDYSEMSNLELADLARGNAAIISPSQLERAELRAFLLEVAKRLEALTAAAKAEPPSEGGNLKWLQRVDPVTGKPMGEPKPIRLNLPNG